jgi:NADP-dependent 3-hydroxy acid dehydrogenase YdfG
LKIGREEQQNREGIMEAEDVAAVAVAMAALPDGVNMLESVIMPIKMPLVGRG